MSDTNRRDTLQRLYDELGQIHPADAHSQQVIADARADIERALAGDADSEEHESLIERLQDTLYHFEGTHSDLATAINTVITSLSNMGL